MKLPAESTLKASDLIPMFGIWNKENRSTVNRLMWTGMIIGGLTGLLAGVRGWGRPLHFAFYGALSVETYTLMLALKLVQKRHHQSVDYWALPWHRLAYWVFFFLLAEGATLLLEVLNPGYTWFAVLQSMNSPDGVAFTNPLNVMLIGLIVAFPSKIILGFTSLFIQLPPPASELAENVLDSRLEDPVKARHAVPREINDLVNATHKHIEADEHARALKAALKAVAICPESAVAHNNLGCALANLGRIEEAIKEFKKAQDLIPHNLKTGIRVPDPYLDPIENLEKAYRVQAMGQ
jgi:tetratricopeptide (TPR) repeat protein